MPERIFLLDAGEPGDDIGLDRIGGLPPRLRGSWPETEDGEPMLHLLTVDALDRVPAPEGGRLFSIFVRSLEDIDRFDEGDEDPYDVVVRWSDLSDPPPPTDVPQLEGRALRVRPWMDAPEGDAEDAFYALADAIRAEGGANVSYLGGARVNPAAGPCEPSAIAGPFVARLAERLFSALGDPNFAGGGWLFAFERDGWVEQ